MRHIIILFLLVTVTANATEMPVDPAYSGRLNKAVGSVVQAKLQSTGLPSNDPRYAATYAGISATATTLVVGGVGSVLALAGAPVWATLAVGAAAGAGTAYITTGVFDWYFSDAASSTPVGLAPASSVLTSDVSSLFNRPPGNTPTAIPALWSATMGDSQPSSTALPYTARVPCDSQLTILAECLYLNSLWHPESVQLAQPAIFDAPYTGSNLVPPANFKYQFTFTGSLPFKNLSTANTIYSNEIYDLGMQVSYFQLYRLDANPIKSTCESMSSEIYRLEDGSYNYGFCGAVQLFYPDPLLDRFNFQLKQIVKTNVQIANEPSIPPDYREIISLASYPVRYSGLCPQVADYSFPCKFSYASIIKFNDGTSITSDTFTEPVTLRPNPAYIPPEQPVIPVPASLNDAISQWSSSDANSVMDSKLVAALANDLWKKAAAMPGYTGSPYDSNNPISDNDVQMYASVNPTIYPTNNDLLTNPFSTTSTVNISPAVVPNPDPENNPTGTEGFDFGEDPGIESSELEDSPEALCKSPTLPNGKPCQSILPPVFGLLPTLRHYATPAFSGVCPQPAMDFFGNHLVMTAHCDVIDSIRPTIYPLMGVLWLVVSVLIILKA